MRADITAGLQLAEHGLRHAQGLQLGEDVVAGFFAVDHQKDRAVTLVEVVRARADLVLTFFGLLIDAGGHAGLPRPARLQCALWWLYNRPIITAPGAMSALGYDAMNIIAKIIQESGKSDPESIRAGLAALKDYPGVTGMITIDAQHNATKPAVVLQIKGGKFTYYTTIKPDGSQATTATAAPAPAGSTPSATGAAPATAGTDSAKK